MQILSNKFLSQWVNFWVFIFCISVLSVRGHGGEAAIILLLTMGYIFVTNNNGKSRYRLTKDEIIFIALVMFFWLSNVLNTFHQPEGLEYESVRMAWRAIDNPMRWILMLPIYFLFRRFDLDWKIIAIGLSIGVLLSVSIAAYETYFLDINRASGGLNHVITFGELMVVTDLLLWVFMIFAWSKNHRLFSTLIFIASLIAFYGSLLSATRGAWLVYVLLMLTFIFYTLRRSITNIKYLYSKPLLLRIFFVFVIFFTIQETEQYQTINQRTVNTISQISEGKFYLASGERTPMFRTAIEIAKNYPFGVGTDNFRNGAKTIIIQDYLDNENITVNSDKTKFLNKTDLERDLHYYSYLESYYEDGNLKFTSRYRHAHNEWLNVLAENGFLGFILLSLLFIFPLKVFWQNLKNENQLASIYSYCGITLISSFSIFGQSQSIFTSHAALIFFIFFLYLFLAQISKINSNNKEMI
jgi:O-antigen ligase